MEDLINVSVNRKEMLFHWHKWTEINFIIRGSADGVMNNRTIKKNDIRAVEEVSADTLVFRDGTEISEIMPFIRKYSGDTYSIRQIRLKGSLRISSNRLEKHTWRSLLKRRNAYR